jgi:hypothetical protein
VAAARRFAALAVVVFVAPVVAPLTGALVLATGSWRAVFVVLAAFGLLLAGAVRVAVPESLPVERRRRAALFGYIAGSTFVFQGVHGMSPGGYALVFATNAVGMVLAGATFGRLAGRLPVPTLLVIGAVVALAAAALLTGLVAAGAAGLAGTWACLFATAAGLGMMLPAAVTVVQERGRSAPGATSGLIGIAQFALSAAAAPLPGLIGGGQPTALPTESVVLGALLLAVVALAGLARPRAAAAGRG